MWKISLLGTKCPNLIVFLSVFGYLNMSCYEISLFIRMNRGFAFYDNKKTYSIRTGGMTNRLIKIQTAVKQ
jgi:hypothetical protein